jgi:hypothetical protein
VPEPLALESLNPVFMIVIGHWGYTNQNSITIMEIDAMEVWMREFGRAASRER